MSVIRSVYYSTNATSAKIVGVATIVLGLLVIDTYGFISSALFIAAGAMLLFGAGDQVRTGLNRKNLALVIGYFVTAFVAFSIGVA